ncbi:hypothetical protein A5844_001503 [Enterococcus sp. 10A9_DIV0425]|uniref:Uncharacterized protein n=1 Tax=Candidatus Enterococcus wittei TaxID=1987383 RepID=A0A242K135_9ENTE|nr:hypothetical protein A5844_001503 [Enterococcus sp. 10A9_DIV0425]
MARILPLWSFNIGNNFGNITFEKKPEYGTYDLLNSVKPRDIIPLEPLAVSPRTSLLKV